MLPQMTRNPASNTDLRNHFNAFGIPPGAHDQRRSAGNKRKNTAMHNESSLPAQLAANSTIDGGAPAPASARTATVAATIAAKPPVKQRATKPRGAKRTTTTRTAHVVLCDLSAKDLEYRTSREQLVGAGLKATISAAKALHEIKCYKDGVLWRPEYESFAAYCKARWDYERSQAYRLVRCGDVLVSLERECPNGDKLPSHESQVRPMLALPENKRATFWQGIVSDVGYENVTGEVVAEKVREHAPKLGLDQFKVTKPNGRSVTVDPVAASAGDTPAQDGAPGPQASNNDQGQRIRDALVYLNNAVAGHRDEKQIKALVLQIHPLLTQQLGLEWAKPMEPVAPPVTATPAPAEVKPALVIEVPLSAPGALSLNDEIRATLERLEALVAKHRKAVEGDCQIQKLRRTLELEQ